MTNNVLVSCMFILTYKYEEIKSLALPTQLLLVSPAVAIVRGREMGR